MAGFAFPTVAAGHYQLNFRPPAGYPAPDPYDINDPDMREFVLTGSGRHLEDNNDLLPEPIELDSTRNSCGQGR
ncbi:MAG TPA: hypothetical protein VHF06_18190 [Pseudonocardiaceae bacterium]|jgi:hypothetical protein|nr:hypothetical protein [Pseudonocardiaceae bacterium]